MVVPLLWLAAGCAERTSIHLSVQSTNLGALSRFDLAVGERRTPTAVDSTLTIKIPDAFAGISVPIDLWGIRDERRFAHGTTEVTPILHAQVDATVVLTQLPCGAWCSAGATTCVNGGTAVCEQRDEDLCFEWSDATPCPPEAPYCSFGVCGATCVDECADGETRCDGPDGVRVCGEADNDPCKDWLPVVACADGESCSNGACAKACRDECEDGAVACLGAGVVRCGDRNGDGCLEWGPVVPCGAGETCNAGVCGTTACTDECTEDRCDGTLRKVCGNFDLDPCRELSPGTSCVPSDPCVEGMCSGNACQTAPKVCQAPPASSCKDTSTLVVYDSIGSCAAGGCEYAKHEVACANCPACDACAGVTCNQPQSVCYAPTGTCAGGSCTYAYADGVSCDDGDGCTTNDRCGSGVCAGMPKVCNMPPAAVCLSATTLRTFSAVGACSAGACAYPPSDVTCANGCSAGACLPGACVSGTWMRETVDATGTVGLYSSLEIDAAGGLHVSYYDSGNGDLKYAYQPASGAWTTSTVDASGDVGRGTSLAVAPNGALHVSYRDYTNHALKYAFRPAGGAWALATADATTGVGVETSIGLDSAGGVHIAHRDESQARALHYAYKAAGGSFTNATIDAQAGEFPSLGVDSADGVWVACRGVNQLRAGYKPAGGSFSMASAGSLHDGAWYTSLAVQSPTTQHVSYYDFDNAQLIYALHTGGTWTPTTVDASGGVGEYSSIAIDSTRRLHISYRDAGNGDLRYATKPVGGVWSKSTIDAAGDTGYYTSIAVAADGTPHITYYDGTNKVLRHAYRCP